MSSFCELLLDSAEEAKLSLFEIQVKICKQNKGVKFCMIR